MIRTLRQNPFLRVSLALLAGVYLGFFGLWGGPQGWIPVLLFCSLFSSVFHLIKGRSPLLSGLSILLASFLLGLLLISDRNPQSIKNHFSHFLQPLNETYAVVERVDGTRCWVEVLEINRHQAKGKMILSGIQDSLSAVTTGSLIYADLRIQSIQSPQNPAGFDFRVYYASQGIFHQAFVKEQPLLLVPGYRKSIRFLFRALRVKCKKLLEEVVLENRALALCQALLLGDKRHLPDQMKETYAMTGTMHILAVSGLHLGILYFIIQYILSLPRLNVREWRVLQSVVVILVLWCYAVLVGATSSVCRAATMFTLFEGSRMLSRNNSPLNSLSVAAFLLVVMDPLAAIDVGFQLSFLAVTGIVLCYRKILSWWIITHPLGNKVWQMVAVSLAAQLFTMPLSIYYFHQFPLYFWLSGLVAIPLAFTTLATGFLLFAFSWIPLFKWLVGSMLAKVSSLLNGWVDLVGSLPGVVWSDLWIDRIQLLLLFALVGSLTALFYRRRGSMVLLTIGIIVSSECYAFARKYGLTYHNEVVIYANRRYPEADLFWRRHVLSLLPKNAESSPASLRYRLARKTLGKLGDNMWHDRGGLLSVSGLKIYRPGPNSINNHRPLSDIDVVWICNEVEPGTLEIFRRQDSWIVLDGSLPPWESQPLYAHLMASGFKVHHIRNQGAFRYKFR